MLSFRNLLSLLVFVVIVLVIFVGVLLYREFFEQPNYQSRITIVLDSVEQLSVLTSIRYNYSNLVTSEREMPGLLSALYGERLVLVAIGHVTAGVDLSQLEEDDIGSEGDTISIRLPPPQLQDCFLNESASYVVSRDTGIFARSAPELDSSARRFAVQQFRDAALEQGILDDASDQAGIAIGAFLEALQLQGITTIDISTSPPEQETPFPDTCM